MLSNASLTLAALPYGRPAMIAPAANTSGYVASMAAAIAPPADSPVMDTRFRSIPCAPIVFSIICRIDSASPRSRRVSLGRNQLKQVFGLFAVVCSGSNSRNP